MRSLSCMVSSKGQILRVRGVWILVEEPLQVFLAVLISATYSHPSSSTISLVNPVLYHTGVRGLTLAHLAPAEVLKPWPQRPIDIVVLAGKSILTSVTKRIELVSPMAIEEEPFLRRIWSEVRRAERVILVIVCVGVKVQERVP